MESNKKISIPLAALALVVSLGTLAALLVNAGKSNTNAADGNDSLILDVSSEDLTIEVADSPVFAVLPVELTVEEATQAGYTLTAFAEDTDLVSTTDNTNIIPMVAADEGELVALADNTYGLTLDNKPASKDDEVYTALSTDADNPTFITDKDYEATPANDKTTIYYGFYITPDTPKGTYEGSNITYTALTNLPVATVTFDGNGLVFDDGKTTSVVKYAIAPVDNVVVHSSNVNSEGDQTGKYGEEQRLENITIPGASTVEINARYGITADTAGITIVEGDWDGDWGTIPENMVDLYSWEENLSGTEERTFNGDTITIYSESWGIPEDDYDYGYYITITGYDVDGNIVYPTTNKLASGTYLIPTSSSPYVFLGWSEDKDATEPTYTTGEEIEEGLYLAPGDTVTLYTIWQEAIELSFDGNGGDGGEIMNSMTIPVGETTTLPKNTYIKEGYSFIGWNTTADGSGETYHEGDQFTASDQSTTITLYAQWVYGVMLDTGTTVNAKLKRLTSNSSASYDTQDTNVTTIARASTLPADFVPTNDNTISIDGSANPVYAWYDTDTTTIYYYTESDKIIMSPNSSYMFYNFSNLSDATSIADWDTSIVTDMSSMFHYAGYNATTFSLDLSSWDTSKVTKMNSTFYCAGYNATTWSIGDISSWDTSRVTSMRSTFSDAGRNATTFSLDLSSWDTSKVTNMYGTFNYAGFNATTWSIGDISSWDTSKVTSMLWMFKYAGYNATTFSLDLSSWDTSKVTSMYRMFYLAGNDATTWSIGDISSWDTSQVTNMYQMFYYAGYNATTFSLDLSSWDTSKVTNMSEMFTYYRATTWSITIPQKTGDIDNTTSAFYGRDSSVYATPPKYKSFTLSSTNEP